MNATIRLARQEDAEAILAIYQPYIEHSAFSFETVVPTVAEFWNRISKVLETASWLVCAIDDNIVGYAYASPHRYRAAYGWNREVSVYVHPNYRRRKVAKALYTTLIELSKLQGYTNLLAGIVLPNPPSIAFHQSTGFQLIGTYHNVGYKFGQYHDTQWWELFIGDDHPTDLLSMEEVQQQASWKEAMKRGEQLVITHLSV